MMISTKRILAAVLAGAVGGAAALLPAAPASAQYETVANAPGVANVSVIQGSVVIVRDDGGDQFAATINSPLLAGDYLSTAGNSRAEVQFDGISTLRLAQDTQVRFVSLDPSAREIQLAAGTSELAELQSGASPEQVDTPSISVRPNGPGNYRVSVLPDGSTLVTVRSGSATIETATGSRILTPGSTLVAYGDYQNPQMSQRREIAYDAFDTFNRNRDEAIVASYNDNQYLAPQLAGYSNFADYGSWSDVPGYGQAWSPSNQSNGWMPYSNGQWTWEPGYGYTWVGNEPWGYVPYHYGRWFNYNNQWMWQPPNYQYQTNTSSLVSSWLPALVGFFLGGGNGNFGSGFDGNIGWVPLAPGEQYVPWYSGFGPNAGYPQYGVSTFGNYANAYRNLRYVKTIRMYPVERFRNGQWSRPILMRPSQIRKIIVVRGAVPVVPTRALLRTGTTVHRVTISQRFRGQRFASRPIAIHAMNFAKAQSQLETITRRAPKIVPATAHAPVKMTPYQAPATRKTYRAPEMKPVPVHTTPVRTTPVRTTPIRTMRPAPVETMRPVQRHTMAPEPIETMRPVQRRTVAPAPVPVYTRSPLMRATPMPEQQQQQQQRQQRRSPAPPAQATAAPDKQSGDQSNDQQGNKKKKRQNQTDQTPPPL